MGNSRSRNRNSRRGGLNQDQDINRLADLWILRNELEQRQDQLRRSVMRTELRLNEDDPQPLQPEVTTRIVAVNSNETDNNGNNPEGSPPFSRSILRRFIRHHLLMDYLESHPDFLDEEDDEDETENNNNDDNSSASTYEGVQELFVEEDADIDDDNIVREKARKIEMFREKVADIFEKDKFMLEKKVNAALDVHVTLQDLIKDKQSSDKDDQKSFIQKIISDIHQSEEFIDQNGISSLSRDLDEIGGHVRILKELTSVSEEDEVNCTVCLSCPGGVIWDCIKCDHLLCDVCRKRVTSCPTCRVRFRAKAPRRNRWAEKLARLQREKTILASA